MKVALCLHGLAKGKNFKHGGLQVSFEYESELYKKHFIDANNADVFIHSWSKGYEKQINETYQPIRSEYESSRFFCTPSLNNRLHDLKNLLTGKPREPNRLNNIYSRWYSLYRVIEQVKKYELENEFEYDLIMVTRFDMSLLSLIDCNDLDRSKFYVADWVGYRDSNGEDIPEEKTYTAENKKNKFSKGFPADQEGILDFWFITNSKNMKDFASIYLEVPKYIKHHGMSNHKIALQKIKDLKLLNQLEFKFTSFVDFCLTRWMS